MKSLRRVTMRFHLTAFAGEFVGDVAIELHEKCDCTLFALVCTTCESRPSSCHGCDAIIYRQQPL